MSWPYPLFGLLRRPSVVVLVGLLALPIVAVSLIDVAPGKDLQSEIAAGVAQVGMVAMSGAFAGMLGMLWSLSRHDLWRSGLDWHLPGIRRWLLLEELLVGGAAAVVAALWIVVVHSDGSLLVRVSVAVSFSLMCFLIGGLDGDPSTPRAFRVFGFFAWYVLLFQAAEIELVLLAVPPGTVLACLALTAALLARRFDRRVARRRPHDPAANSGVVGAEHWRRVKGPKGEWGVALVSDRYPSWFLAAVYEGGGGRAGWPVSFLGLGAGATAVTLHFIGSDLMAFTMLALMIFASTVFPFRLVSGLVYPLSRRRRGQLVAAGALLTEASFIGLSALMVVLLKGSPFADVWHAPGPREAIPWPVLLMVAFAWMPIVSWGSVRAAAGAWRERTNVLTSGLVPLAAYVLPVLLTLGTFGDWWREGQVGLVVSLIVAISVLTRLALWWATQRHFARADLSPVANPG